MKKLFWIIFLVVMCLLSFYKIAEAASWTLPGQIKKGDLIVATSTTQAVRLPTSTQGSVLWISSAGMPAWTATSTLGISGGVGLSSLNGQTGSTQTFATNTTATGLNLNITSAANVHTWALSLQGGYGIPLTASTTEWTNFNNTPSTRITAGNGLAWSGNTLSNTMASSTLIAGGTATFSPSVTIATSTDTNLLLQVVCATATCTFTPQWTGTLAAARLNSNVVQAITNDTNVTGSISAQNLTLGWTGVLAASRGGIGTTTLGDLTVSSSNLSITGGQKVLIGTSTQITLTDNPTFTKGTFTNASTSALTASGNVYFTGLTSQPCIGTSAAGLLQAGTCTGGSGNSAWTIGNGLIYNATSTDSVLIGTSTPTSATVYLQGSGTKNPITIASSTGTTLFQITSSAQILTCTTCRLTIPQGTAPTLSAAGDIAHDTTNDQLLYGSQPNVLYATSTKALFLQSPSASENYRTSPHIAFDVPITITKVTCRITSEASNVPSWTFSLPHSTSLGVSTADAMTSGQACTSTTTEQTITTAGDLTLAAGEAIWASSSAVSNASSTEVTIYFKYDRQ